MRRSLCFALATLVIIFSFSVITYAQNDLLFWKDATSNIPSKTVVPLHYYLHKPLWTDYCQDFRLTKPYESFLVNRYSVGVSGSPDFLYYWAEVMWPIGNTVQIGLAGQKCYNPANLMRNDVDIGLSLRVGFNHGWIRFCPMMDTEGVNGGKCFLGVWIVF